MEANILADRLYFGIYVDFVCLKQQTKGGQMLLFLKIDYRKQGNI